MVAGAEIATSWSQDGYGICSGYCFVNFIFYMYIRNLGVAMSQDWWHLEPR